MFVASTIDILVMKEDIDEKDASTRLMLSLENFCNATSTHSHMRCVEIIEQLVQNIETSKNDQCNKQTQSLTQSSLK